MLTEMEAVAENHAVTAERDAWSGDAGGHGGEDRGSVEVGI